MRPATLLGAGEKGFSLMKLVTPVLDYLGIGQISSAPDTAVHRQGTAAPWYRSAPAYLVAVGCLVVGFFFGWRQRNESVPHFADRPTMSAYTVLGKIGGLGVECDEDLEFSERPSGTWVFCKGSPRFDLQVSPSIEEAYEAFDLASLVGCYTVGNLPFKQFYVARESNWNLLTHDEELASDLARLQGVTITVGACDVPTSHQSA
jgi:hypothetical protein